CIANDISFHMEETSLMWEITHLNLFLCIENHFSLDSYLSTNHHSLTEKGFQQLWAFFLFICLVALTECYCSQKRFSALVGFPSVNLLSCTNRALLFTEELNKASYVLKPKHKLMIIKLVTH
uniref:Uncharacterized protein n=1 Tax=Cyprinus carpio carpio TaxID=630221 RepID=A0A9J7Z7B3_CYPCA